MDSAAEYDELIWQLIERGGLQKASAACKRMNLEFPEFEQGWYTASHLALLMKMPAIALEAIDKALQLSPGRPEWLFQRIEVLNALGDLDAARPIAEALSEHQFESVQVVGAFAKSLSRLGMKEKAREQYARAAVIEPDNAQRHYDLAKSEHGLSNIAAADKAVSRCIDLQPDNQDAYYLRTTLMTHTSENNNVDSLESALERAAETPRRRVKLCYALARELSELGDYEKSFSYLAEGSSLRRSEMNYNPQHDLDTMQSLRDTYTAQIFESGIEGHINAEPIFVVGLPRTGNTLLQRILGSHSVVHPAGRLPAFSTELTKQCLVGAEQDLQHRPELIARSTGIDFAMLGERYIARTRPGTGRTAYFVDGLPLNFLFAGLIHLALPKAKIISLERDPMDTCFALYKNLLEGRHPYSYDLKELANYYVAYRQLMKHWQAVMPGVIHVVKYEALTENSKPVVEGLLSYCGLSFEDDCLDCFETDFANSYAITSQKGGDSSESSIGKWRNYQQQLEPVSKILAEAG